MSKFDKNEKKPSKGIGISKVGKAVDEGKISEEAKERFKRPAYQYTSIEQKGWIDHFYERFMKKE